MTDYNTSLDLIAKLVKQFHTNRAAYHAPEYKEADVCTGDALGIERSSEFCSNCGHVRLLLEDMTRLAHVCLRERVRRRSTVLEKVDQIFGDV